MSHYGYINFLICVKNVTNTTLAIIVKISKTTMFNNDIKEFALLIRADQIKNIYLHLMQKLHSGVKHTPGIYAVKITFALVCLWMVIFMFYLFNINIYIFIEFKTVK